MLTFRDGRKCVQFSCTVYGDRVCCADCELREAGCTQPAGPCQNDPERCGLEDKAAEPPENLELLALEVAARVMEAAGLCRHESRNLCRRKLITKPVCEKCLAEWCLNRAKAIRN